MAKMKKINFYVCQFKSIMSSSSSLSSSTTNMNYDNSLRENKQLALQPELPFQQLCLLIKPFYVLNRFEDNNFDLKNVCVPFGIFHKNNILIQVLQAFKNNMTTLVFACRQKSTKNKPTHKHPFSNMHIYCVRQLL